MVGDQSKPRGKLTSYAFFVQICREEHKRKFPDEKVDFSEFSRKCADRWKTMSDIEKKRFNMLAESDKRRWDVEMSGFNASQGKKGKVKKIKDPNAPKKPMSSYFFYANDMRNTVKNQQPGLSLGELSKTLGKMWSELDAAGREKYEAMTVAAKAQYGKDKAAYDAGGESD